MSLKNPLISVLQLTDYGGSVAQSVCTPENVQTHHSALFLYSSSYNNLIADLDEYFFQLEEKSSVSADNLVVYAFADTLDIQTKYIPELLEIQLRKVAKELHFTILGVMIIPEILAQIHDNPTRKLFVEFHEHKVILTYFHTKIIGLSIYEDIEHNENTLNDIIVSFLDDYEMPIEDIFVYSAHPNVHIKNKYIFSENKLQHIPVKTINYHELQHILLKALQKELFSDLSDNKLLSLNQKAENFEDIKPKAEEIMGFTVKEKKTHELQFEDENIINKQVESVITTEDGVQEEENEFDEIIQEEKSIEKKKKLLMLTQSVKNNWMLLLGIFLLIGSLFIYKQFVHKLYITVYTPLQPYTKELTIDAKTFLPLLNKQTIESQAIKTIQTTGIKQIGEKAKGKVKIFNCTTKDNEFPKNTTLAVNGIKFLLNESVKISSASLQTSSNSVQCTSSDEKEIIAEAVGTASNIATDTILIVQDASKSNFYAKITNATSGGTQKDVRVVSNSDIDQLKKLVAQDSAQSSSASAQTDDLIIIPNLTESPTAQIKLSKQLNEEANEVTMTSKGNVIVYSYKASNMNNMLKSIFEKDPALQGKNIVSVNPEVILATKEKGGDISAKVTATAKYSSTINTAEFAKSIVGKSLPFSIQQPIESYKVTYHNPFIFRNIAPSNINNIIVTQLSK